MSEHAWVDDAHGGARCPVCGSVKGPDGMIQNSTAPFALPLCDGAPPSNHRREIDGVIVIGPPS